MRSLLAAAVVGGAAAQMNGDAPGGLYHRSAPERGVGTMLPVPHNVAHRGEYIDAYSPTLSTVYGEVFWTMMAETPRSVKHCNSTYYHYGVMAQWQMRGMWAWGGPVCLQENLCYQTIASTRSRHVQ